MKNLTPEYAQYLRELVYEAGCVDREHKVFGSSSHNYLLKPPLPDLLVFEYEKRMASISRRSIVFLSHRWEMGEQGQIMAFMV